MTQSCITLALWPPTTRSNLHKMSLNLFNQFPETLTPPSLWTPPLSMLTRVYRNDNETGRNPIKMGSKSVPQKPDQSHCLAGLSLSDLCLCVVCYLLVIIKLSGAFMSGTQHEEDNEAKLPFTNGYRNVIIFSIYWHLFLMANRKHRMVE